MEPINCIRMKTNKKNDIALTSEETKQLHECKSTVLRQDQASLEVAKAVAQIKEQNLFRVEAKSFGAYCKKEFQFTRQRAYQLVSCDALLEHLSTTVDKKDLPPNERVVRPLLKLKPDQQVAVWKEVISKKAKGVTVTSLVVTQTLKELGFLANNSTGDKNRVQNWRKKTETFLKEEISQLQKVEQERFTAGLEDLCVLLHKAVRAT